VGGGDAAIEAKISSLSVASRAFATEVGLSRTKVERVQFRWNDPDEVKHVPTGAWFRATPGYPEVMQHNWGKAGDVLVTDEDFDRGDVWAIAALLLVERLRK